MSRVLSDVATAAVAAARERQLRQAGGGSAIDVLSLLGAREKLLWDALVAAGVPLSEGDKVAAASAASLATPDALVTAAADAAAAAAALAAADGELDGGAGAGAGVGGGGGGGGYSLGELLLRRRRAVEEARAAVEELLQGVAKERADLAAYQKAFAHHHKVLDESKSDQARAIDGRRNDLAAAEEAGRAAARKAKDLVAQGSAALEERQQGSSSRGGIFLFGVDFLPAFVAGLLAFVVALLARVPRLLPRKRRGKKQKHGQKKRGDDGEEHVEMAAAAAAVAVGPTTYA